MELRDGPGYLIEIPLSIERRHDPRNKKAAHWL
jgi:hypothetical protein